MSISNNQSTLFTSTSSLTLSGTSVNNIPIIAQFWMYIISNSLSFLCSLIVLYYLLFDANLRNALNNHVPILILLINLITEVTNIPLLTHRMYYGYVLIPVPIICQIWKYIAAASYTVIPELVAWTSFERHLFIFNERRFIGFKNRLLFHYVPVCIITTYHLVLYFVINIFMPCFYTFSYTQNYCGVFSCVYLTSFTIYEFFRNGVLSSVTMLFFNITLIIRVVHQRYRIHRHVDWRKHRKLTLQLLSIVSIFYIFYFPLFLIGICRYISGITSLGSQYYVYGSFFSVYINFLLPFTCISTIPQLTRRIKKISSYFKTKPSVVVPSRTNKRLKAVGQTPIREDIA